MSDDQKLGGTGRFPDGKISKLDEGELAFAIASDPERRLVVIDFGKPVKWMAMGPSEARGLAKVLIEKANELEN